MTVRTVQVTFDCADPRALSLFWNDVLGYVFPPPPPGFDSWDAFSETLPPEHRNSASASVDPDGAGPRLFFQRVPEGKAAKNRLHLDVRAAPGLEGDERMAALEAECGAPGRPRRHPRRAARARPADERRAHRHGGPGRQRLLLGLTERTRSETRRVQGLPIPS